MKLALVIGSSSESVYAINVAKQSGYTVWAFDQNPNACGFSYADKCYTLDINDTDAIVKELNGRIPNLILPVPIGRTLVSVGKMNDRYKLVGITEKNADICTDKYIFHKVLNKKKLRNISCALIQNTNLHKIMSKKYPAILKPRFGSGSRAVKMISDQKQLTAIISSYSPLREDFVIEDCVIGQEYGVDGAIINGKVAVTILRKKINTSPPICQCVGYIGMPKQANSMEIYNSATSFLTEVISVLNIKNALFHADLVYDMQKNWFIIELSPRPSGHNLHNLFTIKCTGIDIVNEYIKYAENNSISDSCFITEKIKPMIIHFFNFENLYVTSIPDENYLFSKYPLVSYKCNIKKNDFLGPIIDGKSIIDRGFFILEADSVEALYSLKDKFLLEFDTRGSL
ncbi:ATP-grasp domain-containing protein [Treponema sp. OMZ 840]|uniref:ATP-grasp domain-containing protein n=1 Tax=Treponema sp. OMZ 840 TaxID=244313 RepID=UPI003D924E90